MHYNVPGNNAEFWRRKLVANRKRDRLVTRTLAARGWTVVRVWEHSLKQGGRVASRIVRALGRPGERGVSAP